MLVAAIGDPGDAEAAYATWRRDIDLDSIRGAAVRVLPLLADRADESDDHPVNHRIAKVVRFSWLKSQLLITRTLPGVEALLAVGVPVMATKGAAVVHHSHGRLHLRPMDDLDIAVPRTMAGKAARVLMSMGLETSSLPVNPRGAPIMQQVHALPFRDAETGAELDLHWQVIHGSLHRRASNEFWERAVPGDLRGTPVQVLVPRGHARPGDLARPGLEPRAAAPVGYRRRAAAAWRHRRLGPGRRHGRATQSRAGGRRRARPGPRPGAFPGTRPAARPAADRRPDPERSSPAYALARVRASHGRARSAGGAASRDRLRARDRQDTHSGPPGRRDTLGCGRATG